MIKYRLAEEGDKLYFEIGLIRSKTKGGEDIFHLTTAGLHTNVHRDKQKKLFAFVTQLANEAGLQPKDWRKKKCDTPSPNHFLRSLAPSDNGEPTVTAATSTDTPSRSS